MKPKSIILLIIFFKIFNSGFSQNTYSKVILDSNENGIFAKSAIPTFDNGYVIIGRTQDAGFIVKVDSIGNPSWNKIYLTNINVNPNMWFHDVIQNYDSTFIVVGSVYDEIDSMAKALCIKFNNNGDIIWQKKYNISGFSSFELYNIEHTSDSGYIMIGQAYSSTNILVIYIAKIDSYGNLQWSQILKNGNNCVYSTSIKQTIKKDYVLNGYISSNLSSNWDAFIMELDSNGIIKWSKELYSPSEYIFAFDIEITESGFVSFIDSYDTCYVVSSDTIGNTIWVKSFESYGGNKRMKKTSDNGFAIYYGNCGGSFLIKTDSMGNIEWSKNIMLEIVDIIETKNNELIAIGNGPLCGVKGFSLSPQIGLVKFDTNGNNYGCTYDYNLSSTNDTIFEDSVVFTSIFGGSQSSLISNIDSVSLYNRDGCVDISGETDKNTKNNDIHVFPSPANNTLSVYANSEGDSKAVINVYDLLGSKVLTLNDIKTSGKLNKQIDISSLANGTYIIQIAINNSHYTGRFVKQ